MKKNLNLKELNIILYKRVYCPLSSSIRFGSPSCSQNQEINKNLAFTVSFVYN